MQKEDLNVLIVEDDQSMGKVLKEAFSRAGYRAQHVIKPDDALSVIKLQTIHVAIIDCMLPKMNGRDLAQKIKAEGAGDCVIFLMSGIYKDKNFAREAMQTTGARGFFVKPFEIEDVLKAVEAQLGNLVDPTFSPLHECLVRSELSHKERIKAINDTGEVHGFELPWIISLLMHPKISGHLNIITAEGDVCGVGFLKGNIVQVNQQDAKSYFGVLMVEHGFILQSELDEAMKMFKRSRKIGEQLVEANLLSPHAIQLVMAEQQGLRLSRLVANTSIKVNFIESDEMREDAMTERPAFIDLLNDWLLSKLTTEWLKKEYIPWLNFNLKKGQEFSQTHRVFSLPVLARVPHLLNTLLESDTLEAALAKLPLPEDDLYRAFHALIVSRVVRFGESRKSGDLEMQRKRLAKLDTDLTKQNFFERLGVSQKAKDSEIKRAYHDLAKILHPDKMGPEVPNDIRELARQAFAKVNEAYETLTNSNLRSQYLLELEKGSAAAILQAEQLTMLARQALSSGDISKGRDYLEEAAKLSKPTSEARLLLMWTKMKSPGMNLEQANLIRDELTQIPPEDRHNPTFFFVKGLLLRASGEEAGAKKSLEHAVNMSPDFIDARRELNAMNHANKQVDLLRGDLKDVVGMLFKKKK